MTNSMDVHFSSNSNEWQTPKDFFNKLDQEFHFLLDAAATAENTLCPNFYCQEDDALTKDWSPGVEDFAVWCNPPYGRLIGKFVEKAYKEALKGCTVVMLIPARTDTKWWHEYCAKAEVRFIKGRLKFVNPAQPEKSMPAPFPSAVVIFRQMMSPHTSYIEQ